MVAATPRTVPTRSARRRVVVDMGVSGEVV
jgi:hypothetical protein